MNSLFWKCWCIKLRGASRSDGSHSSPCPQPCSQVSPSRGGGEAQRNTFPHECGRKKSLRSKFPFLLKPSQRSSCRSPSQSEPSPLSHTHNSLAKRANYSDRRFVHKQMPIRLRWEASDDVSFPEQEAKDNKACQMSCLLKPWESQKDPLESTCASFTLCPPAFQDILCRLQRKFPERSHHPEPH